MSLSLCRQSRDASIVLAIPWLGCLGCRLRRLSNRTIGAHENPGSGTFMSHLAKSSNLLFAQIETSALPCLVAQKVVSQDPVQSASAAVDYGLV